jgi:hypothetical protein
LPKGIFERSPQHRAALAAVRKKAPRTWDGEPARGYTISRGYKNLTMQAGHPLADATGKLGEHRKVLYDKIGPGSHPCHWGCGKVLEWGGHTGIQADHVDGNKLNNDKTNLVPSCSSCNCLRAKAGNPANWSPDV